MRGFEAFNLRSEVVEVRVTACVQFYKFIK